MFFCNIQGYYHHIKHFVHAIVSYFGLNLIVSAFACDIRPNGFYSQFF